MHPKPRRRRAAGSLGQLKSRLWATIEYTTQLVEDDFIDHETRLKGATSLIQAALAYAKLLEQHEMQAQVVSLEDLARQHLRNGHAPS